jgi:GT2 family glycosyltransferase
MSARTAILIVNWNTRDMLLACLRTVAAHAPGAEVWVIDNASHDGSAEAVEAQFPAVKVVRSPENVGFARANNDLIARTDTPYVWLLNSDTEIAPGALAALEAYMDAHPGAAAVGSALVNPDGSPQACSFGFVTPGATWAEWLYLPGPIARLRDRAFRLGARRDRGRTDWVLGASMLVRRTAVEQVGVLDDGYFMYSEEMDWCRRFAEAGWEVHLETESVVMHHGGGSTRQLPERMLIELFKSRARYFRRHLPWTARAAYGPLLILGAAWNSLYVLAGRVPGARAATQWAIARTAWPGQS